MLYLQVPTTIVLLLGSGDGAITWRIAAGLLLIVFAACYAGSRKHLIVARGGTVAVPAIANRPPVGSLDTP